VAGLLERVEAAAALLEREDGPEARAAVADALEALAAHLLAHLELEEESVAETLRRWEPADTPR
jgi:predicted component of type VI protein secretion system